MKPTTCKQIGCAGISCKHYKPTDKYPYYECQKDEVDEDKDCGRLSHLETNGESDE